MKVKTLQQIYDFCLLDRTYNEYFNIPDQFKCKSRNQYRYYYNDLSERGQSRSGTYLFHQAQMQLIRFLGVKPDWCFNSLLFFLDKDTDELANRDDYQHPVELIYVRCHIRKKGVLIEFSHPFNRMDDVCYYGRSHQLYTEEGVQRDVINYINKHLLFPPGRYRDLQIKHQIYKNDFVNWYKNKYLPEVRECEHWEHLEMREKYEEKISIDYDESYSLLQASGIFFDLNCDEFERDELACQFMRMCNNS